MVARRTCFQWARTRPLELCMAQSYGPNAASESRGSKYQIFKDSGSKSHTPNGFWDQSPGILGTWTLWGILYKLYILTPQQHLRIIWTNTDSYILPLTADHRRRSRRPPPSASSRRRPDSGCRRRPRSQRGAPKQDTGAIKVKDP